MRTPPSPLPVDTCIYCRGDGGTDGLSREHIVPYGLGGTFVLPAASCSTCADITKRFEQACLRQMFGAVRAQLNYPTRRKHERPNRFSALRIRSEVEERITVAIGQHPTIMMFFVLDPPGLLRGQIGLKQFTYNATWACDLTGLAAERTKDIGSELPVVTQYVDLFSFCRMLAKIAHGFAVAQFGIDGFYSFLTK